MAFQRITWSCQSVREQTLIIQVIEELRYYTNLDFCYVTNIADADVKIGIIPDANAGGKSTVGRSATIGHTPYTMMLAENSPLYLIRHEFFHTLGFLHEHQSPRRPFSINIEGMYTRNTCANFLLSHHRLVRGNKVTQGLC